MAGGTFRTSQKKVLPGMYLNIKNGRQQTAASSTRGVAIIPLIGYDWGPRGEFITITVDSPDAEKTKLGRSIYDTHKSMLMLQLMLMGASTVYVYIVDGGAAAKAEVTIGEASATVTARYKGTLGNTIKLVSVANPIEGYDVSIILDGTEVELFERVTTIEELADVSEYVTITGTGAMEAFASVTLTGGSDDVTGNAGITEFLDKSEKIRFNCMAFPSEDEALQAALLTKIRYIRESIGWKCQAVAPNFDADYEGIINLTNSFEYDDTELTIAQATAWVAGATAGADLTTSLTYAIVAGATKVIGDLTNEQATEAVQAGKTFFSLNENGNVILLYDINSVVTFTDDKPADVNKNRPLRVYDTWANDLLITFIPGKYDNHEEGWIVMEGIGRAMLKAYQEDGAITNVDLENDFVVDRSKSIGDSTYINSGLQAVDSADKYYITTIAR